MLAFVIMLIALGLVVFIPTVLTLMTVSAIPILVFMMMWYFVIRNYLTSESTFRSAPQNLVDFFIGALFVLPASLVVDRLTGFFCSSPIYVICPKVGEWGFASDPIEIFLRKIIGLAIIYFSSLAFGRSIHKRFQGSSHNQITDILRNLLMMGCTIFLLFVALFIGYAYSHSKSSGQSSPLNQYYQITPQGESTPLPPGFRQLYP